MAYKADINIAVKGTRELDLLSKRLESSARQIDNIQKKLVNWAQVTKSSVVPSLDNLNRALRAASNNFDKSVMGTKAATNAANNLVTAERAVNKELRERADLLGRIRENQRIAGLAKSGIRERTQYSGPIGPGAASGVLGGQSAPVDERIQRSLQTRRDEEVLQKALQKMELKSVDTQNKLLNARAKKLVLIREEVAKGKVLERMRQQRRAGSGFRDFSINAERFGAPSSPIMQGPQVSSAFQESFLQEKNRQRRLDRQLKVTRGRRKQQQMQGATANALIGGAFPLLFGQGAGAAVGGAAGGFGGGMMGGQFGFALSLVGTNVGAAVDAFVKGSADLGKAMNKATMDTSALVAALGMVGTIDERRINQIQQLEGKQAAFNAAMEEMKRVVGDEGAAALQRFGESTKKLQDAWSKFMTRLMAGVAIVLEKLGIISAMENQAKTFNRGDIRNKLKESGDDPEIVRLRAEIERVRGSSGGGRSGAKNRTDLINSLQKEVEQRALILLQEDQTIKIANVRADTIKLVTEDITKQKTLLEESLALGNREAKIKEKVREINKQLLADGRTALTEVEQKQIEADLKHIDNLNRIKSLWESIRQTLSTGIASAIEGLITGTQSLGDSLANIAKSIGSMLIQTGISNMMGGMNLSFFGKGVGSANGNYLANGIRPFASGGMVTRPTMGLVGEAGEDEYVIPASKMAQSMQRYSAGARGQSVIPGTGASSSGGASGSSTTVNYSGPILNFNSEEFIPKSAVGQIISTAARQGAAMGETSTMKAMQNSRSARSRIGM